jgi:hypothetical protein
MGDKMHSLVDNNMASLHVDIELAAGISFTRDIT